MTSEQRHNLTQRLTTIINSLRYQRSATDVHIVGNIRNTAQMLLSELNDGMSSMDYNGAAEMVRRVENKAIVFFMEKYRK